MLLDDVKANLRKVDNADDAEIARCISAATAYAEDFQNKPEGYYASHPMSETTRQAIVLLASHYFDSPDGATGGFMNDTPEAAKMVDRVVKDLLQLRKDWGF